jgi:hypothetical protein
MADLRVTDAIIADTQHGFQAAAAHLEPVTQAVLHFEAAPAGATAMTSGLADQNLQLAVLFAAAGQCLARLAQDTAQAGQEFGQTDQALGREVSGTGG